MYNAEKLSSIDLGRQGENLAKTVEIDVSGMLSQWPEAVITLLVRRKHDAEPYIADTTVRDGVLFWPITTVETADAGDGKLEIRATCGEVIAKSATGTFRVTASLTGSGTEPPESEQGWVDKVIAAGAGVEQSASQAGKAADRAEAAAETAESSIAQIRSAAETATAKAAQAQESAEAAENARTQAEQSAQEAAASQAAAQEAKTSAAGSASAAEQARVAAQAAQEAAAAQAATAGEAAQTAGASAQAAQTSANAAAESRQAAQTAATQAEREAQAASAAQSEAENARDNANASAEAAAGSADAAGASADAAAGSKQAASDAAAGALESLSGAQAARDAAQAAQEAAQSQAAAAEQSAVEAGEAAQLALGILDDTVTATDSTWSSRRIADVLCAPFEVSGNPITCHPVEGYPLGVTASWKPKQHFDWMMRESDSTQVTTTGVNILDLATEETHGWNKWVKNPFTETGIYTIQAFASGDIPWCCHLKDGSIETEIRYYLIGSEPSIVSINEEHLSYPYLLIGPLGNPGEYSLSGWQLMIEKGNTPSTSYEPYTGGQAAPCPDYPQAIMDSLTAGDYYVPCTTGGYWKVSLNETMGGVPGYADAVEVDAYTGRYRLVRRTAVLVLDGTETWSIGGKYLEDGSDWYYQADQFWDSAPDAAGVPLICDHYPMAAVSNNNTLQGVGIFWRRVRVRWGTEGTVEDWVARLAASPVTVRYALVEPVVVTGQAELVATVVGMTKLGAVSMGMAVADPDHPCVITGAETVMLAQCGKNLMSLEHGMRGGYGYIIGAPDMNSYPTYLVQGTTYTLSFDAPFSVSTNAYINSAMTRSLLIGQIGSGGNSCTFTMDQPSRFYYIHLYNTSAWTEQAFTKWQLELGTGGTAYEPYREKAGTNFILPKTVYGGEMDATTGMGIASVYGVELDGSEGWTASTIEDRVYFQCALSGDSGKQPSTNSSVDAAKRVQRSSHFAVGNPWASDVDDCFWVFSTPTLQYPSLRMRSTSNFASVEELKSYLAAEKAAGTPVTIVYETIASEAFSAEGATSIPALTGTNTLYTDADSLNVSGRADPNAVIESLTQRIAALEQNAIGG